MALGKSVLLLLYTAPDAAAVVLRLLLRVLLLLLLQLLRGCDKTEQTIPEAGRVAGHFVTNKTKSEKRRAHS